jgi:hypothetical protein
VLIRPPMTEISSQRQHRAEIGQGPSHNTTPRPARPCNALRGTKRSRNTRSPRAGQVSHGPALLVDRSSVVLNLLAGGRVGAAGRGRIDPPVRGLPLDAVAVRACAATSHEIFSLHPEPPSPERETFAEAEAARLLRSADPARNPNRWHRNKDTNRCSRQGRQAIRRSQERQRRTGGDRIG